MPSAVIVGCGYLGLHVAERWAAAGWALSVLTRKPERAKEFASRGWQALVGDVASPESLLALPRADVLLYAVGYDRSSGVDQRRVTIDGLQAVLDRATDHFANVVFTSTTSVYGQSDGAWVDERSECFPTQVGGQLALEAETRLRAWHESQRNPPRCHILRLAGLYGPGRVLTRVEQLQAGTPLAGDPRAYLNLVHVDDVAAFIEQITAALDPAPSDAGASAPTPASAATHPLCDTVLLCDDSPVTRGEYYAMLAALCGAPPPHFAEDLPARRGSGGLNKRCSNRYWRESYGYSLQFPNAQVGLRHALGLSGE